MEKLSRPEQDRKYAEVGEKKDIPKKKGENDKWKSSMQESKIEILEKYWVCSEVCFRAASEREKKGSKFEFLTREVKRN